MKPKAIVVLLLTTSILMTACSSGSLNPGNNEETEITSTETTLPPVYDFEWGDAENEAFAEYIQGTLVPEFTYTLNGYIHCYGFTDELNKILTDFVNERFDRNYESVPFSEVDYLYGITKYNNTQFYINNYEKFCDYFLDADPYYGMLNNKLTFSYLIQNNIPYGECVSAEIFKTLLGEGYLLFERSGSFSFKPHLGNFDEPYKYSNEELASVLLKYNDCVSTLCADADIKTMVITDSPETCEIYNGYLKDYFGNSAPQFGKLMTAEQYKELFGEEPMDLSYLPKDVSGVVYFPPEHSTSKDLYGTWVACQSRGSISQSCVFNEDNTGAMITEYTGLDYDTQEEVKGTIERKFTYEIIKHSSGHRWPGKMLLTFDGDKTEEYFFYFDYGDLYLEGGNDKYTTEYYNAEAKAAEHYH